MSEHKQSGMSRLARGTYLALERLLGVKGTVWYGQPSAVQEAIDHLEYQRGESVEKQYVQDALREYVLLLLPYINNREWLIASTFRQVTDPAELAHYVALLLPHITPDCAPGLIGFLMRYYERSILQRVAQLDGYVGRAAQQLLELEPQAKALTEERKHLRTRVSALRGVVKALKDEEATLQRQIDAQTAAMAALARVFETAVAHDLPESRAS